jgi:NAD(P)-dependent dehydrogenase (short-subunit alcohol dehydrogenase family)
MRTLEGRTAVVTGAASGIGLAISQALVVRGMQVVMADINESALRDATDALRSGRTGVLAVPTDVADPDAVEALAERTIEEFGALHVAVNNAGIVNRGLTWDLSLDDWHRVIDINLWGVVHGVRAFVPRILSTGVEGHVVNVASMAAVSPSERLGPYTVAKHGVLGLSDVLRADLAEVGAPVGVSTVMPGKIRTGMNPIGSVEPADVAVNVVDAIIRDRSYVFTDDHSADAVKSRLEAIIAARSDVIAPS